MRPSRSRLLLLLALFVGRAGVAQAGGGSCTPIDNPCDPAFSTASQDCSAAYPQVGTTPLTTGPMGIANFGGPQVNPMLQLRARGSNPHRKQIFVLNTPNHELTVLDRTTLATVGRVRVGLDPSALAQTKDGSRILVSNWTSDTVSVVDTATLRVVATIEHRADDGRPLLSEPMGIAIAGDEIAYVASSATNQIAVIDLFTLSVTQMIDVPTTDPRAIALNRRKTFLAVAGFASGNRTEGMYDAFDPAITGIGPPGALTENCGDLVTNRPELFDAAQTATYMNPTDPDFRDAFNCLFAGRINSVLTGTGLEPLPIIVNPRIPDHDVAIISTATLTVVATSAGMPEDPGTLNYGISWDKGGRELALANTHARNEVDFGDRPWRNRLTRFTVDRQTGAMGWIGTRDLDVDPGATEPVAATRAATPFSVIPLRRKQWAVAAAGSDRLAVVNETTGAITRIDVGFVPRALVRATSRTLYVMNAGSFTVEKWDVKAATRLAVGSIGDNAYPMEERHGFHLFNGDQFSSNRTFSCASCHPDGDTDHLVWLLDCTDGLRLSMTLRQIEHTLPFHWSGDKCNGKKIMDDGVTNLFKQPSPPSACDTDLTWQFIESLRQPPPSARPATDNLSADGGLGLLAVNRAVAKGIADFTRNCNGEPFDPLVWPKLRAVAGDPSGAAIQFNRSSLTIQGAANPFSVGLDSEGCGSSACHASPFSGRGDIGGFTVGSLCFFDPEPIEAVSFLGMHDRLKSEDDGRSALYDLLVALDRYRTDVGATAGPVLDGWGVPRPGAGLSGFMGIFFRHAELEYQLPGQQGFALTDRIEEFVEQMASGPSAITGQQATATETSTPMATLTQLVDAADDGKIRLIADGVAGGAAVDALYDPATTRFVGTGLPPGGSTLAELLALLHGTDALTFTAGLPKPLEAPFSVARGAQAFLLSVTRTTGHPATCSENYPEQPADFFAGEQAVPLVIWSNNLQEGASVFVNGVRHPGSPVRVSSVKWTWTLDQVPPDAEVLTFQIQNPGGLLSNDVGAMVLF